MKEENKDQSSQNSQQVELPISSHSGDENGQEPPQAIQDIMCLSNDPPRGRQDTFIKMLTRDQIENFSKQDEEDSKSRKK
jgi:hypothetical protein